MSNALFAILHFILALFTGYILSASLRERLYALATAAVFFIILNSAMVGHHMNSLL